MINKVDFENLRGCFSKVMGTLKPMPTQDISSQMDKFDAVIKPMVGNYDEVDVLIKLTYKNVKGEVKTTAYRPIQKQIVIPEDTVYYYATIKLLAKKNEVILETRDNSPFFRTQSVYVEENLPSKQKQVLRTKIKNKETLNSLVSMENIENIGFIKFKETKTLSL